MDIHGNLLFSAIRVIPNDCAARLLCVTGKSAAECGRLGDSDGLAEAQRKFAGSNKFANDEDGECGENVDDVAGIYPNVEFGLPVLEQIGHIDIDHFGLRRSIRGNRNIRSV